MYCEACFEAVEECACGAGGAGGCTCGVPICEGCAEALCVALAAEVEPEELVGAASP